MDQLDPSFIANVAFTTSGALVDIVDKKVIVVLRDGRKLIGVLRSYDQYANLVLQDAVERIHFEDEYAEIPRGIYLVRGENVVLMGEIDLDLETPPPSPPPIPSSNLPPDHSHFPPLPSAPLQSPTSAAHPPPPPSSQQPPSTLPAPPGGAISDQPSQSQPQPQPQPPTTVPVPNPDQLPEPTRPSRPRRVPPHEIYSKLLKDQEMKREVQKKKELLLFEEMGYSVEMAEGDNY